jgi:hypothetical protein
LKTLVFLFACFSAVSSFGQGETYRQTLYWIRYQNQLIFSPSLSWNNEIDNRRFINPDVQNQLIFHSRIHYKVKHWDYATGVTVSNAYAQRPENGFKKVTTELRPVAEVSHEFALKKFTIQNRIRVDNRFFEDDEEQSIFESSRFVFRARYRFQLRIPFVDSNGKIITGFRFAEEIMINNIENTFDQNRIYGTLDWPLNDKFSLETGYIYIYQQRFGTADFFRRHVLRFSLIHKITSASH